MGLGSLLSQIAITAVVSAAIAAEGCLIAATFGLSPRMPSAVAPAARRLARQMAWLASASALGAIVFGAGARLTVGPPPGSGFVGIECGLAAFAAIWLVLLATLLRPAAER
jgi:hypothetical protein